MQEWIVPAAAGVLALVALVLAVALVRARSRTDEALARSHAETAALREQLAVIERRLARPATAPEASFVITGLGQEPPVEEPAPTIQTGLFADLVLRETVVKAASLAHGVRRALDPETRNRIRFEMRRELRRARKQRKADAREARRDWAARQRAAVDDEGLDKRGSAA
jgi:hypothetical protein